LRAAALAALALAACTCPDGHHELKPFAQRALYATEIDACLAADDACEALCRAVLTLDPNYAVTKCVVTAMTADGVQLDVIYYNASACLG